MSVGAVAFDDLRWVKEYRFACC